MMEGTLFTKPLEGESRYLVRWPNRCLRIQLRVSPKRLSPRIICSFKYALALIILAKVTIITSIRRWNYWGDEWRALWVFKSWPVEFSLILFIYVLNVERTKRLRAKFNKASLRTGTTACETWIQSMGYRRALRLALLVTQSCLTVAPWTAAH